MANTYRAFGNTQEVLRGVSRMMLELGHSPLAEFSLPNGRRLDVAAVSGSGAFIGVEIKISVEDLRADTKWQEYLEYCDHYYFAVPDGFPQELLPPDHGLIIADRFGGAIVRQAQSAVISAARRKAMLIRFARIAAERHARLIDPQIG
jgi:hypothetical protein